MQTYLVVLVEPEESQVRDTNRLPVILHLLTRTIYDVGYFVCHHKFEILYESQQEKFKLIIKAASKRRGFFTYS